MSWWIIITCAILAALLAIPQVNGLLLVLSFGMLWPVMKTIGLVALAAPAAFALTAIATWLARRREAAGIIRSHAGGASMLCLSLLMVHTGASYGFSRMRDGLASMGGKNMPFVDIFLAPLGADPFTRDAPGKPEFVAPPALSVPR